MSNADCFPDFLSKLWPVPARRVWPLYRACVAPVSPCIAPVSPCIAPVSPCIAPVSPLYRRCVFPSSPCIAPVLSGALHTFWCCPFCVCRHPQSDILTFLRHQRLTSEPAAYFWGRHPIAIGSAFAQRQNEPAQHQNEPAKHRNDLEAEYIPRRRRLKNNFPPRAPPHRIS